MSGPVTSYRARPQLAGTFGMVSATHWIPASVAMGVLERGGNAFDAAVAAGFVLQVVQPHQNGPGGDLVAIFSRPGDAIPTVLCGQGPAPARATVDAFEKLGLDVVPGSGLLPAAIPGATPAWLTLLRDHGTISLSTALEAAIHYAGRGHPVMAKVCEFIARVEALLREHWVTSAEIYLPGGRVPMPGELLRNSRLADTYKRLIGDARGSREAHIQAALDRWQSGFVAAAVDEFARTAWRDSTGADHAGLITGADLASWWPSYESALGYRYRGYDVYKPGPWSQGPLMLQQLALLEGVELNLGSASYVHTIVEGAKLAFADREAWYGDVPDVPLAELLSREYNNARRGLIGAQASFEMRPGAPRGIPAVLPELVPADIARRAAADTGVGEPNARDASVGEPNTAALLDTGPRPNGEARTDTVHVDVVDRWGNMVAAMPSGGWLHSSPVIPELGFGLGTRLQMASLKRGRPNTLMPGKRPRTTLSPTMVMRDGKSVLAFGSPGGDQQDQWQLGLLLHHLVGGRNLQEAIDAPAFHTLQFPNSFYPHEYRPGVLMAENRLGFDVLADLERRGHQVVRAGDWALGRLCAVARDPESGLLFAAANPREIQAYAAGR
jgi:gamma-glutamyltranspeptidase / glutathione hydrolase